MKIFAASRKGTPRLADELRVGAARRLASCEIFFIASAFISGIFAIKRNAAALATGCGFVRGCAVRLYDTKAIARFINVTERRVRQLKDKGVIKEYKPGSGLYDLIPTNHAYIKFRCDGNQTASGEEVIDYPTERAKLARAKRLDAEYDLRVKEKTLHEAAEIEAALTGMLSNFKARLLAIPAKLSPLLSKKTDKAEIFELLKANIDEVLLELASYDVAFREGGGESGET